MRAHHHLNTPALLLLLLLLLAVLSASSSDNHSNHSNHANQLSIHVAFPTECGLYFVWQSIGMVYSHGKIRQPGPLTRIVSCTPEEWEAMPPEARDFVPTHVAPNYAVHPRTGDRYPAYNKPMAVIDWLAKTDVKEDYVLIIDADMIMRRPILPDPSSPLATSAFFGYMIGVNNELALKHVPEVTPREDELAGPKGRRGDKAGGFTMMQTEQLRRVAPLWLQYTEDVRADPDAWKLSVRMDGVSHSLTHSFVFFARPPSSPAPAPPLTDPTHPTHPTHNAPITITTTTGRHVRHQARGQAVDQRDVRLQLCVRQSRRLAQDAPRHDAVPGVRGADAAARAPLRPRVECHWERRQVRVRQALALRFRPVRLPAVEARRRDRRPGRERRQGRRRR